jgi:uncharacterized protein (TIGR02145 family)/prepilin-type N-terminal cleavage/methylation domain-containing protein
MIKRDLTKLKSIFPCFTTYHLQPTTYSKAFTIVELLVVIVVIGILAAITIISYTGISKKAEISSLQSDLSNGSKKLKMYQVEYGSYPQLMTSTDGNVTYCPSGTTPPDTKYCIKPSKGNTFNYFTLGVSTSPDGFGLKATNSTSTTNYTITNNSSPALMSTLAITDSANWVVVGTQVWAKKNLNVGTRIAGASAQTNNGGTNVVEKYCYGDTDAGCTNTDSNGIVYGGLYQWNEAMQYVTIENAQGICPAGSHIPSDNDWKILEMRLGMSQAQADATSWRGTDQSTQLKSGGTSELNVPLAGYGDTDGSFDNLSLSAYLWSSSESNTIAWLRRLGSVNPAVIRGSDVKGIGFSVRCLGN